MNTVTKSYEPWRVDEDRPESMLSRFANTSTAGIEPSAASATPGAGDPNGICALHVGYDMPADGKESTKCGFAISAGSDRKVRFWDLVRPELSSIVSGLDASSAEAGVAAKPRYETMQPTTSLTVTTEQFPNLAKTTSSSAGGRSGSSSSAKKGHSASASRPPRSTVISLQQQQLLKS
ncbi:hypothetical protein F66182_17195, partial [Fusarium sp. NRRL 66182]